MSYYNSVYRGSKCRHEWVVSDVFGSICSSSPTVDWTGYHDIRNRVGFVVNDKPHCSCYRSRKKFGRVTSKWFQ